MQVKTGTQTIYFDKNAAESLDAIRKLSPRSRSKSSLVRDALMEYRLVLAKRRRQEIRERGAAEHGIVT